MAGFLLIYSHGGIKQIFCFAQRPLHRCYNKYLFLYSNICLLRWLPCFYISNPIAQIATADATISGGVITGMEVGKISLHFLNLSTFFPKEHTFIFWIFLEFFDLFRIDFETTYFFYFYPTHFACHDRLFSLSIHFYTHLPNHIFPIFLRSPYTLSFSLCSHP